MYFCGKSHFGDDCTQKWFVFQPIHRYFKLASDNPNIVLSWKSKGLPDESIKALTTLNLTLDLSVDFAGSKSRVRFGGDCIKQKRIKFNNGN